DSLRATGAAAVFQSGRGAGPPLPLLEGVAERRAAILGFRGRDAARLQPLRRARLVSQRQGAPAAPLQPRATQDLQYPGASDPADGRRLPVERAGHHRRSAADMSDRESGTVCITGGAGFIGSHLADAFLAAGRRVVIVDDLSSGRRENVPEGAELHVLDIRSREAAELVQEFEAEVLVHHAAQMDVRRSVEDPVHDASVNLLGGLNLAEAARLGGVRQILFASTGGAIYGEQEVFPAAEDHPA